MALLTIHLTNKSSSSENLLVRAFRILLGLSVASVCALSSPSAVASPWVNITKCDSVNVSGTFYPRFSFSIHNAFSKSDLTIYSLQFLPKDPNAPCIVVGATAPPLWTSIANGNPARMLFVRTSDNEIAQGETLDGFQMNVGKFHDCCYTVYFYGAFFEPFAQEDVCFNCDYPVPARVATWGLVKAAYR